MHNKVILLNGPSSAGKTSVTIVAQPLLPGKWIRVSIDTFYSFLPRGYPNSWELFASLSTILFRTAEDFRQRGFCVLLDTVLERPDNLEECIRVIGADNLFLVGLHCPLDVLEERERQRGNRQLGLAREQIERVHNVCPYDVILDTYQCNTKQCANQIAQMLAEREPEAAGEYLKQHPASAPLFL